MDYYNIFNEFMKSCGYNFSNSSCSDSNNSENSTPPGVADEECRNANSDIPGGFQDLPPQTLLVIVTIIGINVANQIPFNMQNTVGNIFELLGQVIITFNAQQQYLQSGPGRYYNPIYRNSTNPFCPNSNDGSSQNTTNDTTSNTSDSTTNNNSLLKKIKSLENEISKLKEEIEGLK